MVNKSHFLFVSLERCSVNLSIHECRTAGTNSAFMHCEMQQNVTASLINCIDSTSRHQIATNIAFKTFIDRSIHVIQARSSFYFIKLEKLEDKQFSFEKFRLTFYIKHKSTSSMFENLLEAKYKNETYKKINKILFRESKELRKQMVIDEREL